MKTKKYRLMHTGKPYSRYVIIPTEAWKLLSTHASLKAAVRRMEQERAHLDSGTWDDHYQIISPDGNIVPPFDYYK